MRRCLLCCILLCGCTKTIDIGTSDRLDHIPHMNPNDPDEFLECLYKYYLTTVQDYTCVFIKEERHHIDTITVKYQQNPRKILMTWISGHSKVSHVLYDSTRSTQGIFVRPSGWVGLVVWTPIYKKFTDTEVQQASRHTIKHFGFVEMMKKIIHINHDAQRHGDLALLYHGIKKYRNHSVFIFERRLPAKITYPNRRLLLYIDVDTLLPVMITEYGNNDMLLGRYHFTHIRLVPHFTLNDFQI